jgi:hypothetical protein
VRAAETGDAAVRQLDVGRPAILVLLELIAVDWVVQEVGEVVKELDAIALHGPGEARRAVGA